MTNKTISKCGKCGYPITAEKEGDQVTCPNCSTINRAISGVSVPGWLIALGIGLTVGVLAGPAIMAGTETGGKWLEQQVRTRVK